MQNFNIIKTSNVKETFRVSKIRSDFDIQDTQIKEQFQGKIETPENWNIGVIVGGSGTGKTTIARELFGNNYISHYEYTNTSVIDDMPKQCSISDITKMFYAVGFGSVPSWLKPYNVLSNGEKMRCDLARALLSNDLIVFDEFTSVIDRQIAQTACIAAEKAIRRTNKQFIAISCHFDILNWLQPDWIFNTDTMTMDFQLAHELKNNIISKNVISASGRNLGVITI